MKASTPVTVLLLGSVVAIGTILSLPAPSLKSTSKVAIVENKVWTQAIPEKPTVVNPEGYEDFEVTGAVFEKLIEPTLIQPTFVTHLPRELVPLAKLSPDDSTTVEVFE